VKKLSAVLIFALIAVFSFAQQNVSASQKFALVIGNGNYTAIEKLTNPVYDAADIAAKLKTLGYQVEVKTNVTNAAMGREINSFIQKLAQNKNNEGFFWYAGHGVQMDGENYLLPVLGAIWI